MANIIGYVGPDTRFAPWWWQNDDPASGVVEVGGGLVQGMASTGQYANYSPWEDYRLQVVRIVFTSSNDTIGSFNLTSLFRNLPNLVEIDNIDYINLSDTRWLSNMFRDATSLQRIIGLENWDTSAVQRFTGMFRDTNFVILDLSTLNTHSAVRLDSMFRDASHLQRIIGIENFDTGNVATFAQMFRGASALTSLDLSHWSTGSLTAAAGGEGMSGMFRDMPGLISLNLSSWDTRNASAAQMQQSFTGTAALREITLGANWTVPPGASGLGLPPVPSDAPFAGLWQNVANGTVNNPQGMLFFTSPALMTSSNGAANTWVWASATPKLTVIFVGSANGTLIPAPPVHVDIAAGATLDEAGIAVASAPKAGYTFAYWISPQYPGVRFSTAKLLALPIEQNTNFIALFARAAMKPTASSMHNAAGFNHVILLLCVLGAGCNSTSFAPSSRPCVRQWRVQNSRRRSPRCPCAR
ncbi:MAG: BspA family leucine-rich repeat surface protein [Oscillospiraceae bacterium]|nr:BspA family leucine-rich repeat surface protein [Oscillospiraceae bacterium]